jgi:hypothetical protein
MACKNLKRFEKAWLNIAKNKNKVKIVFSTSGPASDD